MLSVGGKSEEFRSQARRRAVPAFVNGEADRKDEPIQTNHSGQIAAWMARSGTIRGRIVLAHADSYRIPVIEGAQEPCIDMRVAGRVKELLDPRNSAEYLLSTRVQLGPYNEFVSPAFDDLIRFRRSPWDARMYGIQQTMPLPGRGATTRGQHGQYAAWVVAETARRSGMKVLPATIPAYKHDMGHGPWAHASEVGLTVVWSDIPGRENETFDHALNGGRLAIQLGFSQLTHDLIKYHSWSLPSAASWEGEMVSWGDRVAYACHDLQDLLESELVAWGDLLAGIPDALALARVTTAEVRHWAEVPRGAAILAKRLRDAFIDAMVDCVLAERRVGMYVSPFEALSQLRTFNATRSFASPNHKAWQTLAGSVVTDLTEAAVDDLYSGRVDASDFGSEEAELDARSRAKLQAVRMIATLQDWEAVKMAERRLGLPRERLEQLKSGPFQPEVRTLFLPTPSAKRSSNTFKNRRQFVLEDLAPWVFSIELQLSPSGPLVPFEIDAASALGGLRSMQDAVDAQLRGERKANAQLTLLNGKNFRLPVPSTDVNSKANRSRARAAAAAENGDALRSVVGRALSLLWKERHSIPPVDWESGCLYPLPERSEDFEAVVAALFERVPPEYLGSRENYVQQDQVADRVLLYDSHAVQALVAGGIARPLQGDGVRALQPISQ